MIYSETGSSKFIYKIRELHNKIFNFYNNSRGRPIFNKNSLFLFDQKSVL